MRVLSVKTLTTEEDMAIDVLTTMEENKKWQLFFKFYLITFVTNITTTDRYLGQFLWLRHHRAS